MTFQKKGFTLVELLIVVLIISILSAFVFKLYGMATRNALKAKTVGILEKVAMALEEFRAEYGMYPPTSGNEYSIGPVGTSDSYLMVKLHAPETWGADKPEIYKYGLVSYLYLRASASGTPEYTEEGCGWIPDTPRDENAKNRWAKYIVDLKSRDCPPAVYFNTATSNNVASIKDGWGAYVEYASTPPYQTYSLWSRGPDGAGGTADDIHRNKMDN